ncbi:HAD family hydrolase [Acidobacteria bacterium AH-259-G07]|nr:HAD family hydrolase [Acidobacteria bacterium AH-259-G07]
MPSSQVELRDFQPQHDSLIAIDSDGCAFDTMEIKHKECFIPNIIKHWQLQAVSKYARAAAEFVNLYSRWRGVNRFPALIKTFDLLREWPDVLKRGIDIPEAGSLRRWIEGETKLGNPALEQEVEKSDDAVLKQALEWSKSVNVTIADMVHGVPPFPYLRETLEKISGWADIIVCSATPYEALRREWKEHDIARFTRVIAGQEMGSKKEHIHLASEGKYQGSRILMVGDAPGDLRAARANQAFFFPINPGQEENSWERFFREGTEKFKSGDYTAEYELELIREFEALLPETPPWKSG